MSMGYCQHGEFPAYLDGRWLYCPTCVFERWVLEPGGMTINELVPHSDLHNERRDALADIVVELAKTLEVVA